MGLLKWLGIGSAMAVDNTLDKKQTQFNQTCKEDIAEASSVILKKVQSIAEKFGSDAIPRVVCDGCTMLPLYAFLKVLQAQKALATSEQNSLLDIYFESITPDFTKREFLDAVHGNHALQQKIGYALQTSSEEELGNFWKIIFKYISETQQDESAISEIASNFTTIMIRFAALENPQSNVALKLSKDFISEVHGQFVAYCNNDNADSRRATVKQHFLRMKSIAQELAARGKDDDVIVVNLYDYFVVGLICTLLEKSKTTKDQKITILSAAMEQLQLDVETGATEVIEALHQDCDLYTMTYGIVNTWNEDTMNYWIIQGIVGQKSNTEMLTVDFAKECFSFLTTLETSLMENYPNANFGEIGIKISIDISSHMKALYS